MCGLYSARVAGRRRAAFRAPQHSCSESHRTRCTARTTWRLLGSTPRPPLPPPASESRTPPVGWLPASCCLLAFLPLSVGPRQQPDRSHPCAAVPPLCPGAGGQLEAVSSGSRWEELVGYSRAVKRGPFVFVSGESGGLPAAVHCSLNCLGFLELERRPCASLCLPCCRPLHWQARRPWTKPAGESCIAETLTSRCLPAVLNSRYSGQGAPACWLQASWLQAGRCCSLRPSCTRR